MSLAGILNQPENDLDVNIISDAELEGALEELGRLAKTDPQSTRFKNKIKKGFRSIPSATRQPSTGNLTAKAEFEKRISMLPDKIQEDLKNGRLQIVDGDLYSIKSISEKASIELMANADDKTIGLTNVNSRKLDADTYFLITAIQLLYAVAGGTTNDLIKVADYKTDLPAIIKNGEFTLELGTEVLIPEMSAECFNEGGRNDVTKGVYKLENPKWLRPQIEIKPELKFAGVAVANGAVKFRLIGATIAKK